MNILEPERKGNPPPKKNCIVQSRILITRISFIQLHALKKIVAATLYLCPAHTGGRLGCYQWETEKILIFHLLLSVEINFGGGKNGKRERLGMNRHTQDHKRQRIIITNTKFGSLNVSRYSSIFVACSGQIVDTVGIPDSWRKHGVCRISGARVVEVIR